MFSAISNFTYIYYIYFNICIHKHNPSSCFCNTGVDILQHVCRYLNAVTYKYWKQITKPSLKGFRLKYSIARAERHSFGKISAGLEQPEAWSVVS